MPRPPNILLITADDHAAAAIGCYGSRVNRTPRIDRIAVDGMRFDRAAWLRGELLRQIRQVGDDPPASLDRLIETVPAGGEDR